LKAGTLIRDFVIKNGRRVTLRTPTWSDLDDFLEIINSLVEEGADIDLDTEITRNNEIDWMAGHLTAIEKDAKVAIAAEVDGRIIGQVDVRPKIGRQKHVGTIGITIRDGYRDIGIGTELMKEAETQAKRLNLKVLTLDLFSINRRALHVYEKAGYRVVGRVPKAICKGEEYIDELVMAKEL
jgi:RimJ/RimL family protein N-acetyltransferase